MFLEEASPLVLFPISPDDFDPIPEWGKGIWFGCSPGKNPHLVPGAHKPGYKITPNVSCSADNEDFLFHASIVFIPGCFEKGFGVKWKGSFWEKGVDTVENWREKLANATISDIMHCAFEHHLLVPAFNVAYLPMVPAIVEALRHTETFALLEVARPDITRFGAKSFKAVKEAFNCFGDPVFSRLHQDHVPVIDEEGQLVDWSSLIDEALALRYHSVMIDGSRLPLEENIQVTKEVVARAHPQGVCVEAELGAVLGHESGPLPSYEEIFESGKGFTDPEDAERFVRETGVDWLSVAIGNIHGAISGAAKDAKKVEARLNIDHLRKIVEKTRVPLVLHGGSGIKKEYVLEAIRHGITKINVGTEIRQAYERAVRTYGDIEKAQEAVTRKVEELVTGYYEIRGSARRLAEFL